MVLTSFSVQNKLKKIQFFEKAFLLADTSMKVVLRIFLLTILNTNMQFVEKKFKWRSYITAKVLSTTKRVELINKREFAIAALDKNIEIFMIYIATLSATLVMQIHPFCQA